MNKEFFPKPPTGLMLGFAILITLTGCVGYVRGPSAGVYVEPSVPVNTVFAVEDDYVYYPGYGMYYGNRSQRWYDYEHSAWIVRPAPRHYSRAPSVRVDFHDSPAMHHNQVRQTYPKNWTPEHDRRLNDRREDHH